MNIDWYMFNRDKGITVNQIATKLLVKMNSTSLDLLVKMAGSSEALAAMKPYYGIEMFHVVEEARNRLKIRSDGADAMLLTWIFAQLAVVPGENNIGEIKEKGAVCIDYDCIYKDASPDFCVLISHHGTKCVAEAINPEYECIFTHHLTNGDPYCRYIFKKKSEKIDNLDDLGKTIMTLPKFNVPKEQVESMVIWASCNFLQAITEGFNDLYGPEKTREVLGENARRIGIEIGNLLKKNEQNIVTIGSFLDQLGKCINQKGACNYSDEIFFEKEITDCVLQTWTSEICYQFNNVFQGIVESVIPDYELIYDRMMTKGDSTCHWIIKLKEAQGKPHPGDGQSEDLARQLSTRLVNGEISEEEYEKKMTLLRKYGMTK
jgi:predicted ArsR family transcriptional regulator